MAALYGFDAFSPAEIQPRAGDRGELVGGSVLVALVYFVIYRRRAGATLAPSRSASEG